MSVAVVKFKIILLTQRGPPVEAQTSYIIRQMCFRVITSPPRDWFGLPRSRCWAPSGPNCLLFVNVDRLADSLWDRSEVGWSPRPHAAALGAFRELLIENFGGSWSRAIERKGPCLYICTDGSRRACGVGACACIVQTLSELRETSGPRIDRIPQTRPPWWRRQYRELKKNFFRPPGSVPLISLDHYRTERYSNGCMSHLVSNTSVSFSLGSR